jgi:CspA family cold shock protein
MESETRTGKVKFYNEQKGFGFITVEADNRDYFVHATGLLDRITKDDRVEFTLTENERGQKAVNVKKINS